MFVLCIMCLIVTLNVIQVLRFSNWVKHDTQNFRKLIKEPLPCKDLTLIPKTNGSTPSLK